MSALDHLLAREGVSSKPSALTVTKMPNGKYLVVPKTPVIPVGASITIPLQQGVPQSPTPPMQPAQAGMSTGAPAPNSQMPNEEESEPAQ